MTFYLLGIAVMIVSTLIVEQNISFGSAADCITGLVLWRRFKAGVQTMFINK